MTKLTVLSATAVATYAVLAGPVFAQHKITHVISPHVLADRCTHDAGNPYSKEEDYVAWSGWRARGGWDDRIDPNCIPGRVNYPGF
ncbi:MAG TPA: hypothetical protein VKT76_04350 [Bradyrhizobium sp.]|nr:hypothetical protein [Bradyrhizobium sp.]